MALPDGWRSPRGDGVDWSPENDAELRRLWASGLSARTIARKIGGPPRTHNAITARARRLGLTGRGSPLKAPKAPSAKPQKKSATYQLAGHASGPVTRGWEKSSVSGCQWIEGDARSGVKCGCAVVPGKAWCAEHRARVYIVDQEKEG